MALNAKTENTTRIALNTNTDEWWLWTPNEDAMMALNTETGNVTLNVKLRSDTDGAERWNETTAPNSKPKGTSMNVNLK